MKLDVLIVGGGMVGATLAWGLGQRFRHWQVGVVEPIAADADRQPSFDDRVIALSAGSVAGLEQMGLWPELAAHGEPIRHIHVAEKGGFGRAQLHHQDYRLDALGQVIPVRAVGDVLRRKLQCHWFCPDKVARVQQHPEHLEVTLASGQKVSTRLLVVADGGRSATRGLLGIGAREQDYQQHAIIANVTTEQPHQGWAFERFTDSGPLALLPMTAGRMNLVLCQRPAAAEASEQLSDADFLALLQRRFGWRLGRFTSVGERHRYPLSLIEAEQLRAHRAVVVGNAAHSLHPIAGQGFNLGLRDVLILLASLADDDAGAWQGLARWQAQRQPDLARTIGLTDNLARLFANDNGPLYVGRNLALGALNHLLPAKDALARHMLGWNN